MVAMEEKVINFRAVPSVEEGHIRDGGPQTNRVGDPLQVVHLQREALYYVRDAVPVLFIMDNINHREMLGQGIASRQSQPSLFW